MADNRFQYHIGFGEEPKALSEIESFLRSVSCGAEVVFQGVVRNDNLDGNDQVQSIFYEGIEGMIEPEVKKIAYALYEQFHIQRFYFYHILGQVKVGESSIWIGISGGHRKEVFEALQVAMDQIKTTVPIFKQEMGIHHQQWK